MTLDFTLEQQKLKLALSGDYLNFDDEDARLRLLEALRGGGVCSVSVNAAGLGSWDSTLVVVLYELVRECLRCNIKISYEKFPPNLRRLIDLAFMVDRKPSRPRSVRLPWLEALGNFGLSVWQSIKKGIGFIRRSLKSFHRWLAASAVMRKVDFLFALQDCSYKAVGIVSLVSFMVGLILAFVGAVQLKTFGAQIYVASLVAIGMTRIMGAIMVGIIMAGRTGASYAATIGTMQVNEEIDALKTMGIPVTDFLVLPRIMALTLAIPFLVILADFMGIVGGGFEQVEQRAYIGALLVAAFLKDAFHLYPCHAERPEKREQRHGGHGIAFNCAHKPRTGYLHGVDNGKHHKHVVVARQLVDGAAERAAACCLAALTGFADAACHVGAHRGENEHILRHHTEKPPQPAPFHFNKIVFHSISFLLFMQN